MLTSADIQDSHAEAAAIPLPAAPESPTHLATARINATGVFEDALVQMRVQLDALRHLDANWDSFGSCKPQHAAIAQAEATLSLLYAAAANPEDWKAPGVSADEMGFVMLEWWHGVRTLTLVFDGETISYLRAWGIDTLNEMEDGSLQTNSFAALWQWFRGREAT